jgi:lysophospholipase L1-like esterase
MAARRRAVLCYGDSLTAGFRCGGDDDKFHPYSIELKRRLASLKGRLRGAAVQTVGLCGSSAAEQARSGGLHALLQAAKDKAAVGRGALPAVVVLLMGTNDLRGFPPADPQDVAAALAELVGAAAAFGARAVLLTVPAMPKPEGGDGAAAVALRARREALNALLLQLRRGAAGGGGGDGCCCCVVDAAAALPPSEAALWDADGLHLSKKGYNVLGRVAFEGVKAAMAGGDGSGGTAGAAAGTGVAQEALPVPADFATGIEAAETPTSPPLPTVPVGDAPVAAAAAAAAAAPAPAATAVAAALETEAHSAEDCTRAACVAAGSGAAAVKAAKVQQPAARLCAAGVAVAAVAAAE